MDNDHQSIYFWKDGKEDSKKQISICGDQGWSIFVLINGDIYFDNGMKENRVDKWIPMKNEMKLAMNVHGRCAGLFIDQNNSLYCSMDLNHQVMKRSLYDCTMNMIIVAGNGTSGDAPNQLFYPDGIFVSKNLTLYIADCANDRIQAFPSNQLEGITVAGGHLKNITIDLDCPKDIKLDNDENLFIVDGFNHRIVRSGPNGFQCLVGCSGKGRGRESDQMNDPYSMAFDSYGNLFVADVGNDRIQKFVIEKNCGK